MGLSSEVIDDAFSSNVKRGNKKKNRTPSTPNEAPDKNIFKNPSGMKHYFKRILKICVNEEWDNMLIVNSKKKVLRSKRTKVKKSINELILSIMLFW